VTGKKTREQQLRIIEKRVNTTNADPDFDPRPDLERQERGLPPTPPATAKTASDPSRPDDRGMHRGLNQESEHHKRRADD
jgi:hypothetical protein